MITAAQVQVLARVSRRKLRRWRFVAAMLLPALGVAAPPTDSADAVNHALVQAYARYLVGGRSEVEIHLSATGPLASARTRALGDGTFSCQVSGLQPVGGAPDPELSRLRLAGLLVHEVTHCQVSPYTSEIRREHGDAASAAATLLVQLTMESVADARAVFELFRVDGAQAAGRYVDSVLPQRQNPASPGHATATALRAALALAQSNPETIATAEQAFAAALQTGQAGAAQTLARQLAGQGAQTLMQSPEVSASAADLATALSRARTAFQAGRFDNRAATLRVSNDGVSASDAHFLVGADGALRTQPVLSAEGAHRAGLLAAMIGSRHGPEHRLAVQWLRRQGLLDTLTLPRASSAFARLLKTYSDGSPAQTAHMVLMLGQVIEACRPGDDLSAVLDNAADVLKDAQLAGPAAIQGGL